MNTEASKPRVGLWVMGVVVAVLLIPVVLVSMTLIPRRLADMEVARLCKNDGGIRVFETAKLAPGESLVPSPRDWTHYDAGRAIGKHFRIKNRHGFWHEYGAAVYKYTVWIERNSDGKTMSEMVSYHREGDEMFHGKLCPENMSDEELISKTLSPAGT